MFSFIVYISSSNRWSKIITHTGNVEIARLGKYTVLRLIVNLRAQQHYLAI